VVNIVKTIQNPQGKKKSKFVTAQEACRKDTERAFGMLQARFAIARGLARCGDKKTLGDIMMACAILHTMTIENGRGQNLKFKYAMHTR
jgi:hypothetical protein